MLNINITALDKYWWWKTSGENFIYVKTFEIKKKLKVSENKFISSKSSEIWPEIAPKYDY